MKIDKKYPPHLPMPWHRKMQKRMISGFSVAPSLISERR